MFLLEIFKKSAIFELDDFKLVDNLGLNIIINDGKNKNVDTNENINPIVIIQPKSMTGLISLNTKDKNAQIVVRTA